MLREYTFDAPAYWASALINGDCTSFSDEESAIFDQWVKDNPEYARDVVSCGDDTWIGRFNGLQTEMLTYTGLEHE